MSDITSQNTPGSIWILGISGYYHDSAACIIKDGTIIAAAQEERFTRKKHDPSFPQHAIQYCLEEGKVSLRDLSHVVFYEKPLVKFERLIETYLSFAPRGIVSFWQAMPIWLKEKLFQKDTLTKELRRLMNPEEGNKVPPILFPEHHESHAASAFFSLAICRGGRPLYGWCGRMGYNFSLDRARSLPLSHFGRFLFPIP